MKCPLTICKPTEDELSGIPSSGLINGIKL